MSVTAKIIRILADAGRSTDDLILVAEAMERGPNAAMMFQLVEELEAIEAPVESKAAALCGAAKGIMQAERRHPANSNSPYGPKDRWGYEGPITPRLPEREWWPLRNSILERDGYVCRYCGDQPERMCADHVIPLSRGGSNDETNLVACCLPCNSSKCDRLLDEWEGRLTA